LAGLAERLTKYCFQGVLCRAAAMRQFLKCLTRCLSAFLGRGYSAPDARPEAPTRLRRTGGQDAAENPVVAGYPAGNSDGTRHRVGPHHAGGLFLAGVTPCPIRSRRWNTAEQARAGKRRGRFVASRQIV